MGRAAALVVLGVWPAVCGAQFGGQWKDEPVGSIRLAFQRVDPRLYWTDVVDKAAVDGSVSVMLVQAAPLIDGARTGYLRPDLNQRRFGVFTVTGAGNRVERTIDIFPEPSDDASPTLEATAGRRVYVHWWGGYRQYLRSTRYDAEAEPQSRRGKTEYGRMALSFVAADGPRLYYRASYEAPGGGRLQAQNAGVIFDTETREFTITATPPAPVRREVPGWVTRSAAGVSAAGVNAEGRTGPPVRLRRGLWAQVVRGGVALLTPGRRPILYQVPETTRQQLAELRPEIAARGMAAARFEPNSEVGPLGERGDSVWFANTFYDGEGQSGVGYLGRIRIGHAGVEVRMLPEMACCAGTALYVTAEGEELVYVGLATRPEGRVRGRGVVRHHAATGKTEHFPIPDVVTDIRPAGRAMALASEHGLYLMEGTGLAQYRVEPAAGGGLEVVTVALGAAGQH